MNENIYPLSTLHVPLFLYVVSNLQSKFFHNQHTSSCIPHILLFLDEEDGDEKGGGRGGKEEDGEKEEPPVAIPMIGDTKTGPLSLIAGQDNHRREPVKKTRVGRESSRR